MHSFTHEQNITCNQTQLDDIVHWQTIICRQLFAGHIVGSQPMKRKKNLHGMIINFIAYTWYPEILVTNICHKSCTRLVCKV